MNSHIQLRLRRRFVGVTDLATSGWADVVSVESMVVVISYCLRARRPCRWSTLRRVTCANLARPRRRLGWEGRIRRPCASQTHLGPGRIDHPQLGERGGERMLRGLCSSV